MEKYTIRYEVGNASHTAEVIAPDQELAEKELSNSMRETHRTFKIIEVIPEGLVAGFEIAFVHFKTIHI